MCRFSLAVALLPLLISICGCQTRFENAKPGKVRPEIPSQLHHPEASAWANYLDARLAFADGDLEAGTRSLENALSADPSSSYLSSELALVYAHRGEFEKAERELRQAMLQAPDDPQLLQQLGELAYRQRKWAEAIRIFEKLIAAHPDIEQPYLQLASCHQQLGRADQAIETVQRLLQVRPGSETGRLFLGRLYLATQQPRQGEFLFSELLKEDDQLVAARVGLVEALLMQGKEVAAENELRSAIAAQPDAEVLRKQLVGILIKQKKWQEALAEMLALDDSSADNIDNLRRMGLVLMEMGNWSEAEQVWRRLLVLSPGQPAFRYYLGLVLEQQEMWQDALDILAQVSESDENFSDALYHRSYLAQKLNRTAEAIALMEQRIALAADRPDLYDFLAALHDSMDDSAAAEATLEQGLEVFPDDVELLYHLGMLLEKHSDSSRALAIMRRVLELDPDHADAMNYIAYHHAVQGTDLQEALQLIERALEIERAPHMLDTLGWIYYRMGNFGAARAALEEARLGLPDDPVVLEHVGDTCAALGLNAEARAAWETSLQHEPDNPALRDKLLRLSNGLD